MKKILIALLVVIVIAAIAATMFLGKMDELIADAIQTEGTAAIGTSVTVDSVETKLADGIAIVNGLSIANPPGYQAPNAISIDTFSAEVDYKGQSVKTILINSPVINAEIIGTKSNFQDLLDGMPEAEATETTTTAEGDDLELAINSLQLRQATVNINSDQLGETSFVMDDFVLSELKGTVGQLSDQITNSLINHVTNQVKKFATAEIARVVKEKAVEEATKAINEKLEEELGEDFKEELGGQLDEALGEELGEELGDTLKDKLKGFKLKIN